MDATRHVADATRYFTEKASTCVCYCHVDVVGRQLAVHCAVHGAHLLPSARGPGLRGGLTTVGLSGPCKLRALGACGTSFVSRKGGSYVCG